MIWLIIILTAMVLLAPVTIQVDLSRGAWTQGRVILTCWRLHKTWRWDSRRPAQKHREKQKQVLQGLRHVDVQVWRFLFRRIRLQKLDMLILLRTGDAARSALLSGTLRSVAACIPAVHRRNIRMQILPEFFREHSTLQLRCIIRLKPGTLILTAGLLLLRSLRAQRLNESEAMQYGTSHW